MYTPDASCVEGVPQTRRTQHGKAIQEAVLAPRDCTLVTTRATSTPAEPDLDCFMPNTHEWSCNESWGKHSGCGASGYSQGAEQRQTDDGDVRVRVQQHERDEDAVVEAAF